MRTLCYENKDQLSGSVIVAGWDPVDGPSVYHVTQGGSCLKAPFALGGSGSTYIYGLMDAEYNPETTAAQAREFLKKAVSHAMARDGSSGGSVRTILIPADGGPCDRDVVHGNQVPFGPTGY
jgi:20S proteasome subunit beta 1